MYFQHVYDKTLAQASYFIGCQKAGVAAVIDPKRDVSIPTSKLPSKTICKSRIFLKRISTPIF